MEQCREKLKKLKSDYRFTKDHNSRRGSTRTCWKRFNGRYLLALHRRAMGGRLCCCIIGDARGRIPFHMRSLLHLRHGAPGSPASSPALLPPLRLSCLLSSTSSDTDTININLQHVTATSDHRQEEKGPQKTGPSSVLAEIQAEEEQNRTQRDENIQLLLSEARENEAQGQ